MGNVMSNPKVSLSIVSADAQVENAAQAVLIVGIKDDDGTATSAALISNLPNDGSENVLFGEGSHVAHMIRMFKSIAPSVRLDVIPLNENAAGTASTYTITVTGTSTEAGSIDMFAGSRMLHRYSVAVSSGQTATQIGASIANAINNDAKSLFTAANVSGTVTLTFRHKGTFGNTMPVYVRPTGQYEGAIAGITLAVAAIVVGATNPTAMASTAIFDVATNNRYQGVVWPDSGTSGSVAAAWLDSRFNVNNKVLDGVAFCHVSGTYASGVGTVGTLNNKSLVMFADKSIAIAANYTGPTGREAGFLVSSAFAALRALRLTDGQAISQYITTTSSLDQFGGTALASLPYHNSTIPVLSLPYPGQGFTDIEIAAMELAGGSIIGQNAQGTNVLVGTVSTTYKTNPAGNADPSWKYLNYVDTMSAVREYFFNNYKKRFAQSRLTEGSVIRGRDMVNKAMFEAYTDRLFGDLTGPDFVLCQAGDVALNFFKKNRDVVLDLETGTITVNMLVPIVTQVRTIIGTIKIAFSTEG